MKGYPDRITRQARVLPSILKSYIPNIENLNFLVRGIDTGSLENKGSERRARKHRNGSGGRGTTGRAPGLRRRWRREAPAAAHPQSPHRQDDQLTSTARHHTTCRCMQSHSWKNRPTEITLLATALLCFGLRVVSQKDSTQKLGLGSGSVGCRFPP